MYGSTLWYRPFVEESPVQWPSSCRLLPCCVILEAESHRCFLFITIGACAAARGRLYIGYKASPWKYHFAHNNAAGATWTFHFSSKQGATHQIVIDQVGIHWVTLRHSAARKSKSGTSAYDHFKFMLSPWEVMLTSKLWRSSIAFENLNENSWSNRVAWSW